MVFAGGRQQGWYRWFFFPAVMGQSSILPLDKRGILGYNKTKNGGSPPAEPGKGDTMRRLVRFLSVTVVAALLLAFSGAFAGCGFSGGTEPHSRVFYDAFDTVCTVYSYRAEDPAFEENATAACDLLHRYHRLLDIYHEYDGVTNLATLNRQAATAPVAVSEELMTFLLRAKELSLASGGAVNIAMGAVLTLWHDARETAASGGAATLPDAAALAMAREHIDPADLILDEAAGTVFFADPALRLDAGAFGKGYVLDRTAELLRSRGAESYVLNYGGNVLALGTKPDGSTFRLGLRSPDGGVGYAGVVTLADAACATSGGYERYYTVDGVRYSHIIDPATGYPPTRFAAVSVLTADAALGDALSTALFCLTEAEGRALLADFPGAEALWIAPDGRQTKTAGFPLSAR